MDPERLQAFIALLAKPDPRTLSKRGHHVTQKGDVNRMRTLWARSARTWVQHRIAGSEGALDGWKPAERERYRPSILDRFRPTEAGMARKERA